MQMLSVSTRFAQMWHYHKAISQHCFRWQLFFRGGVEQRRHGLRIWGNQCGKTWLGAIPGSKLGEGRLQCRMMSMHDKAWGRARVSAEASCEVSSSYCSFVWATVSLWNPPLIRKTNPNFPRTETSKVVDGLGSNLSVVPVLCLQGEFFSNVMEYPKMSPYL